jgi:thioredoxin reductase (NADPH)
MKKERALKVGIIGGGPAGSAAALQLKRYELEPLVFEEAEVGGLIRNAHLVENYPGFPRGIDGPQLAALLRSHLRFNCIDVKHEEVLTCRYEEEEEIFTIVTPVTSYYFPVVVVASGTRAKGLPLVEELSEDLRSRVLSEIHSVARVRGRRFLLIGAGDAAFDYALNLAANNRVVIAHRGEQIKALPLLRKRVTGNKHIRFLTHHVLDKIEQGSRKGLLITLRHPAGTVQADWDYLVLALGREPRKDFYSPQLKEREGELVKRGVLYLAGDVKNGRFRQGAIAVGNGVEAAMKIYRKFPDLRSTP